MLATKRLIKTFSSLGYCLTFTNSCLNPVTVSDQSVPVCELINAFVSLRPVRWSQLYLISGKFRSHFKRYLCLVKRRRKGLVRTHTYKEGRPSNHSNQTNHSNHSTHSKPLLYYSTSIRSSSLNRHSTNSTRL